VSTKLRLALGWLFIALGLVLVAMNNLFGLAAVIIGCLIVST